MEFEIQPEYTVEDFADFWYGFRDKRAGAPEIQKSSPKGMRRLGWFLLLVGLLEVVVYLFEPLEIQLPSEVFFTGGACLVTGGMMIYQWRPGSFTQPKWAKKFWKKWSEQDPGLRWSYRFTPEEVELRNSVSSHRYAYSQLQPVWEDERHFYITLDRKIWHILNKSQFTKGDPGQFAAFLAGRMGRPVQWLHGEQKRGGART